jgi:hypothetical protein
MADGYGDDRRGMMRVHIAAQRGRLAGERYTRNALRAHAKGHGLRLGALRKSDIGWHMAQAGLIDEAGYLRDDYPKAGE